VTGKNLSREQDGVVVASDVETGTVTVTTETCKEVDLEAKARRLRPPT